MNAKTTAIALILIIASFGAGYQIGSTVAGPENHPTNHEILVTNGANESLEVTVTLVNESTNQVVFSESMEVQAGGQWDVRTQQTPGTYSVIFQTESGSTDRDAYHLPMAKYDYTSYTKGYIRESGEVDVMTYMQQAGE